MGKGKDPKTVEKQNITKLSRERVSALKMSKELCRDDWSIKKTIENIRKLIIGIDGKGFKNLLARDESKANYNETLTSNYCFKSLK